MHSHQKLAKPAFLFAMLTLSFAILFGGGQGTLGDTLTQLTALVLLLLLFRNKPVLHAWPKTSLLVLIPLIPLLIYLLPLPNFITNMGPARQQLNQSLSPVIGSLGNQLGFSASATERSIFWILPALVLFLSALHFNKQQKRICIAILLAWIFVGSVVGLAQKANGLDSPLYFYSNTNFGAAVGFFANSNHFAIAVAACLPLIWAGLIHLFNLRNKRPVNPLWFVLFTGMALFFILSFMLSGSRAGLALGMLGCFLMLPAIIIADQHKGAKHWLFGAMAIGLFFIVQTGLYVVSLQFESDALEDLRWQFFPITAEAANHFAPWGSGPASFWFVFPQFDNFLTGNVIVNHAHNDYIELWLEMRWIFLIAALIAFGAFFWQGIRVWFLASRFKSDSVLIARAAWIGTLLLLLHSTVDYPLRTTTLSCMLALLVAFSVVVEMKPAPVNQE